MAAFYFERQPFFYGEKMQKKFKNKVIINMVIQLLLLAVLIVIDRVTKSLVVTYLKGQDAVSLIDGVLELRYLENSGAAFGIFQNMQWMFYIITAIIMILIIVLFVTLTRKLINYCSLAESSPDDFHYRTYNGIIFLNYLMMALAAGAVGNLIDRLTTKYVVDFIYFKLIDFPIFNFADICVTVTAVLLVVFFIFIYRDDPNLSIFGIKKSSDE